VDIIEALRGLDFFKRLEPEIEAQIEMSTAVRLWRTR
jgi:hypothetical protein